MSVRMPACGGAVTKWRCGMMLLLTLLPAIIELPSLEEMASAAEPFETLLLGDANEGGRTAKRSAVGKNPAKSFIDQDYVLALSAANRFLSAWQMRNQEDGLALLSPTLRSTRPEDNLRMYISGLSNPHHEAFEVGEGRQLPDGRFAFEVRLYEHYTGERWRMPRPKHSVIVVTRKSREEWLVDELP